MKAIGYHVRMNPDNSGTLIIDNGTNEEELSTLYNVGNLSAAEVDERAKLELQSYDVEIVDPKDLIEPVMKDQSRDLSFVRRKMKEILKELSEKDVSLAQKKEKMQVYSQMCQAAQVMTNVCKLEFQIDALNKFNK